MLQFCYSSFSFSVSMRKDREAIRYKFIIVFGIGNDASVLFNIRKCPYCYGKRDRIKTDNSVHSFDNTSNIQLRATVHRDQCRWSEMQPTILIYYSPILKVISRMNEDFLVVSQCHHVSPLRKNRPLPRTNADSSAGTDFPGRPHRNHNTGHISHIRA